MPSTLESSPIFVISGAPGAGKTSVSEALMKRFRFGLHIPVDDLRAWVVSGIAHPVPEWTEETTRQFRLAREAVVYTARTYAAEGFAVAIDDLIFAQDAETFYVEPLRDYRVIRVLLWSDVETALIRNRTRTNKSFDTAALAEPIRSVHHDMSLDKWDGWLTIESQHIEVEETVDEILRRIGQA